MQIEVEEEQRLANEQRDSMARGGELNHDEQTEWFRGCEWPI
jgi:hypothetical protein